MLLAIRGLPEGSEATIQTLAERLALKHHSAVELIDRLETHGYVRRTRSRDDRRRVFVSLLPRGERLLEQVARNRISELRTQRGGARRRNRSLARARTAQRQQPEENIQEGSARQT